MAHITRIAHFSACPKCEGAGETIHNDTNPYGYGPDPQCDEPARCDECNGAGEVETWVDPLLAMKRAKWNRGNGWYATLRMRAMRPVSGLVMADMRAMAARCVTACDGAVEAWRRAAA